MNTNTSPALRGRRSRGIRTVSPSRRRKGRVAAPPARVERTVWHHLRSLLGLREQPAWVQPDFLTLLNT
jgi:hypothetical protein